MLESVTDGEVGRESKLSTEKLSIKEDGKFPKLDPCLGTSF